MIAMYRVFNEQHSVLEEGATKQIGAFLSGLAGGYTVGGIVGGVQKRNLKIYQRLEDKLNKGEFRKKSPSMIAGWFLGVIPFVGAFMNLSNQRTIDKIRKEIMKKMDRDTVLRLEELTKKMKKGDISKDELKELAELDSKIFKQFDKEEIDKLKSIAKSG